MNCPSKSTDDRARLLAFVAGTLSGRDALDLSAHIQGCEECGRFVQRQSAVWNLLDEWEAEPVRPAFTREVYARIDRAGTESFRVRLAQALGAWIPRPALTIPVATLLILASVFVDRPIANQPGGATPSASVTSIEAEQLKNAFDDLQLLHQLDLAKDEAPDASRSM